MNETAGFKPKKSVALSGVIAGNTALCTVGTTGNDLHYRGYDILEIANTCEFEEIAYLLIHGKLPTRAELDRLQGEAASPCAACPRRCAARSKRCPPRTHPMDVMRTAASVLGCTLPEKDDHDRARRARHRRSAGRLVRLDAVLLVPLQPLRPAHPGGDRG